MSGMLTIDQLVTQAHATAVEKGWHPVTRLSDITPDRVGALLALVHSEVSEALEAYRNWRLTPSADIIGAEGKPEGFASEIADVCVRVADLCGLLGIDLETAIIDKMAYNRTRPHRHGGKVL